jgi:hypothetical protein
MSPQTAERLLRTLEQLTATHRRQGMQLDALCVAVRALTYELRSRAPDFTKTQEVTRQ